MKKSLILILFILLGLTTVGIIGCGGGGGGDEYNRPPVENPIDPAPIPDDGSTPSPPRFVSAVPGDRSTYLSWEKVFSAVGYNIYQSSDGVTFVRLSSGVNFSANSAVIGNLTNGKVYYFGISAVDERSNESGIAYVGGNGRDPKAFPVVPYGPEPPPPPQPPGNLDWVAGDRKIMLTWAPSPSVSPADNYFYILKRSMTINPLAGITGGPAQRAKKIADWQAIFQEEFLVEGSIAWHTDEGFLINGFTIPAGPYRVDMGIPHYGLPPNYLPANLVPGDIDYSYELWGLAPGAYSIYGGKLENVIPNDDPPYPPNFLGLLLVPKVSGSGKGIYMEWLQPPGPDNSDIRQYILTRTELFSGSTDTVSLLIPQPFNPTTPIIHYQDDNVITTPVTESARTYTYQIFSSDQMGQSSATGSNTRQITIPIKPVEPPPPG